jgi:hypothetical protein
MTIKQKMALKEITENHRSISDAMRVVGYKPSTATKPSNLTKTKGWKELMDQYLPDDKLLAKHDEALEATKVISAKITSKDADINTDDFIEVPDHQVRLKAVELGYKIKGKVMDKPQGLNIYGDKVIAILGGTTVHQDDSNGQDPQT